MIGNPLNAFGTSSKFILSLIPASNTIANVNPAPLKIPFKNHSSKEIPETTPSTNTGYVPALKIATPNTAQFVVMSGR